MRFGWVSNVKFWKVVLKKRTPPLHQMKARQTASIEIGTGVSLRHVKREWNSRRRAYIVSSSDGSTILLSQRLHSVAKHINANFAESPYDRVSASGLYDIANRVTARVGAYHKRLWKVDAVPIEFAAERFEAERQLFKRASVLGDISCYTIENR